jgi:hypothetical protein
VHRGRLDQDPRHSHGAAVHGAIEVDSGGDVGGARWITCRMLSSEMNRGTWSRNSVMDTVGVRSAAAPLRKVWRSSDLAGREAAAA